MMETVAIWFVVGWAGLMAYGACCALWWRHAVRYHVVNCDYCHLEKDGTYHFGHYDGDFWCVLCTLLWPISIVLFTLKCILYMPLEAVVVSIAKSPEQRETERLDTDAEFEVLLVSETEAYDEELREAIVEFEDEIRLLTTPKPPDHPYYATPQ